MFMEINQVYYGQRKIGATSHKILYMRPQGLTQNAQTESNFFTQSSSKQSV